MNDITMQFAGCAVAGSLREDADPTVLSEDMIEVSLPDGTLIEAGWYGQGASGAYRVAATKDMRELVPARFTPDVLSAAETIRSLVELLSYGGATQTSVLTPSSYDPPIEYAAFDFRVGARGSLTNAVCCLR